MNLVVGFIARAGRVVYGPPDGTLLMPPILLGNFLPGQPWALLNLWLFIEQVQVAELGVLGRLIRQLEDEAQHIRGVFVAVCLERIKTLGKGISERITANHSKSLLKTLELVFDLELVGPKMAVVANATQCRLSTRRSLLAVRLVVVSVNS